MYDAPVNSPFGPWALRGPDPAARPRDPTPPGSIAALETEVQAREKDGTLDVNGRLLWASALVADERPRAAVDVLAGPLQQPDAPAPVLAMALLAAQQAGESPDETALKRLFGRLKSTSDGKIAALWMTAGSLMNDAGHLDLAAAAYDQAAGASSAESDMVGVVWALREAVQTAIRRQRLDEATALLRRARRFSPNDELSLLIRFDEARIEALQGRWPGCIAALENAVALADKTLPPDHPLVDHAWVSLAAARMERDGARPETEAMLDRVLGARAARTTANAPEMTEVQLLLGEHHRLNGRVDDALPLIARAALAREKNGERPDAVAHAYLIWSRALEDKGLIEAAEEKRARAEAVGSRIQSAP